MSQCVLLSKQSPNAVVVIRIAIVELYGFQLCEFLYQDFIDDEFLVTILAWLLVLMFTNTLLKKLRHPKMRISQQCRNTDNGCDHLCIE